MCWNHVQASLCSLIICSRNPFKESFTKVIIGIRVGSYLEIRLRICLGILEKQKNLRPLIGIPVRIPFLGSLQKSQLEIIIGNHVFTNPARHPYNNSF